MRAHIDIEREEDDDFDKANVESKQDGEVSAATDEVLKEQCRRQKQR